MKAVFAVACLLLLCLTAHGKESWIQPGSGERVTGELGATSSGWPKCDPNVTQWSGYFDIDASTDKHYFYWAFSPRNNKSDAPIILWLTGGPGCSSSLALLSENGPCHVNETTADLYNNPYSWNNEAYVIYIDQPAGVGFSYADASGYDTNEKEVAEDMYHFLQAFFKAHPDLQSNDFHVSGESYGGHFAPATAHRVWQGNNAGGGIKINLKGLTIGNGLVDPYIQYQYYAELAYTWCKEELGTPCVSKSTYEQMKSEIPGCISLIKKCVSNSTWSGLDCDFASPTCNAQLSAYEETGRNVYNIKEPCTYPPLCYNFDGASTFMNRADVQAALGAKTTNWQACSDTVNGMFEQDWFHEFATYIPPMLASSIRVLVYAGDLDFICNWIGDKHWTLAMDWPKQKTYQSLPDVAWTMDGKQVAMVRSVNASWSPIEFTFMQIHGAGHLVPMDQPKVAGAMINKFIKNEAFN